MQKIQIDDMEIILQFTQNKRAYLRVYPERQEIIARIPRRMPKELYMRFLREKTPWMRKHLSEPTVKPEPQKASRDGMVSILGTEYAIDADSPEFPGFVLDLLYRRAGALIAEYCAIMGHPLPVFRFRVMKSRWGSCNPAKRKLSLNTLLWKLPEDCLRYIVVHELCHLRVPNHSAAFYAEMEKYYPRWKDMRAYMKTVHL